MRQSKLQKNDVTEKRSALKANSEGKKPAGSSSTAQDEFLALLKRAEKGDESAMPMIRKVTIDFPNLWDTVGDAAKAVQDAMLKVYAGDNIYVREAIEQRLSKLRSELAGPDTSPLERLLAERIVACWLQVQYADAIYAQNMKELGIAWSEHHQRRQDRAHRRFLSAVKTLATVRKLALPVLQVNIGDKQVNIAGGPAATQDACRVSQEPTVATPKALP
ncbi:MAG: hypothetical protein ABFE08_00760 [Armatimonadia bacterium]